MDDPLDFGGNPDHVTSELEGRIWLRLDGGTAIYIRHGRMCYQEFAY